MLVATSATTNFPDFVDFGPTISDCSILGSNQWRFGRHHTGAQRQVRAAVFAMAMISRIFADSTCITSSTCSVTTLPATTETTGSRSRYKLVNHIRNLNIT